MQVRFTKGGQVRLYGRPYLVDGYVDGYWHFSPQDPTDEYARPAKFTPTVVRTLAREMKLTSNAAYLAFSSNLREALTCDWGAFSTTEQMSAHKKYPFVKAIDELELVYRDKTKVVADLIKSVNEKTTDPFDKDELPEKRAVLRWYLRWVSAGRDIRALVDFHNKKGNRKSRLKDWELHEINRAIGETFNAEIRGSETATW